MIKAFGLIFALCLFSIGAVDFDNTPDSQWRSRLDKINPNLTNPTSITIDGKKFVLIKKLGKGHFGTVFLFEDNNGIKKAIKIVNTPGLANKTPKSEQYQHTLYAQQEQFEQMRAAKRPVKVPNSVVSDSGKYMIMDYIDGVRLKDFLLGKPDFKERYLVFQELVESLEKFRLENLWPGDMHNISNNVLVKNVLPNTVELYFIDPGGLIPRDDNISLSFNFFSSIPRSRVSQYELEAHISLLELRINNGDLDELAPYLKNIPPFDSEGKVNPEWLIETISPNKLLDNSNIDYRPHLTESALKSLSPQRMSKLKARFNELLERKITNVGDWGNFRSTREASLFFDTPLLESEAYVNKVLAELSHSKVKDVLINNPKIKMKFKINPDLFNWHKLVSPRYSMILHNNSSYQDYLEFKAFLNKYETEDYGLNIKKLFKDAQSGPLKLNNQLTMNSFQYSTISFINQKLLESLSLMNTTDKIEVYNLTKASSYNQRGPQKGVFSNEEINSFNRNIEGILHETLNNPLTPKNDLSLLIDTVVPEIGPIPETFKNLNFMELLQIGDIDKRLDYLKLFTRILKKKDRLPQFNEQSIIATLEEGLYAPNPQTRANALNILDEIVKVDPVLSMGLTPLRPIARRSTGLIGKFERCLRKVFVNF